MIMIIIMMIMMIMIIVIIARFPTRALHCIQLGPKWVGENG